MPCGRSPLPSRSVIAMATLHTRSAARLMIAPSVLLL
ncbi:sugar ABC transporter permease, partial [Rhizobium leguminosarum]